jgi:hypothetical protein
MCGRIDQSHALTDYLAAMEWLSVRNNSQADIRFNAFPGTFRPVIHLAEEGLTVDGRY